MGSCSQGNFILKRLIPNFLWRARRLQSQLKTLNGEFTNKERTQVSMLILMIGWNFQIQIPRSNYQLVRTCSNTCKVEAVEAARENCSVGLLIGTDCTKVLESINIKPRKNDGLYSFKTKFGLCIVGPVNCTSRNEICCNRIGVRQTDTNKVGKHFLQTKTTVKETDVKDLLNRLYNQAFTESGSSESKSEN